MPPLKKNGGTDTRERFADPEPADYHEKLGEEFYKELDKKLGYDSRDDSEFTTLEGPAW